LTFKREKLAKFNVFSRSFLRLIPDDLVLAWPGSPLGGTISIRVYRTPQHSPRKQLEIKCKDRVVLRKKQMGAKTNPFRDVFLLKRKNAQENYGFL
jgi:hypothetical protein